MIVRIVKMTFIAEKVPSFIEVFNKSKELIRAREGCTHLQLFNDINSPNVFFTYSHWNSEVDLDNYRNSELFKSVWSQTKVLFEKKAEAWSLEALS